MEITEKSLLLKNTEVYATDLLKNQLSPDLVFHNFEYTQQLVETVRIIGVHEGLNTEEMELVQVAAWLLKTGYKDTYYGYEEKSKSIATEFLKAEKATDDKITRVVNAILSTQEGHQPTENIEKVLVDAEHSMINENNFKLQLRLRNKELMSFKKAAPSELEGFENQLALVLNYEFYTSYGKEILKPSVDKLKAKIEKRINKLQKAVDGNLSNELGVSASQLKAMKKKLQKAEGRPERGIETMFRLTSKNHLDLSGMADSKANIMISINSIIMSVVLGSLMQKLDSNTHLIYPTILLLFVNLSALTFAILSLRPNISNGLFTRDDIENQRTNLLFFGNFHRMKREDYHWGMNKLMENSNFLYSNLIDDIYFLGVVLARKYKLLRTSYNIFMVGMIVVVIAYIISLNFAEAPINEAIMNSLPQ